MKFVSKSVLCASLFALFSSVIAESTQFIAPRLILKTVINRTSFALKVHDRIAKTSFDLPASQTTSLNFEILNSKNVTALDVDTDGFRQALVERGQFLINFYDEISGKIVRCSYMDICCAPDQELDALVFKCLATHQPGNNMRISQSLWNPNCQTIEILLIVSEKTSRYTKAQLEFDCHITQN